MTAPEQESAPEPEAGGTGQRMSGRRLGRSTAIMASGTFVSRATGWLRNWMLLAAVGATTGAANAYDVANKIPNSLYALLAAGVLNAALVPQIIKAFQQPDGKRIVDRILTVGTVISIAAGLVFTLAAPLMVRLLASGWKEDQLAVATGLAYWIIPQVTFYGIYTLLGQVLNAREQFGPFMWAPVLNNIVSIAGLAAYLGIYGRIAVDERAIDASEWTPERIALLGGTATLGIAAQALILLIPLIRGGYGLRWRWSGEPGEMGSLKQVVTWALAAVAVEQVGGLAALRVATAVNTDQAEAIAGNAAYFQAMTIYIVPHSLVTVSLLTALFTSMSRFHTSGNTRGLVGEISRGARVIAVFGVWASATMIVAAGPITRVMMAPSPPDDVAVTIPVLQALSLGLVPLGLMVLVKRVLFVLEDARSIFYIQIPMTIVWVAVAYGVQAVAPARWWTVGVALGLVASNVIAVILRTLTLRKRFGWLDGSRIVPVYAKSVLAIIPAVGAGGLIVWWAPEAATLTGVDGVLTAGALGVAIAVTMFLVYGIILKLLGVEELGQMLSPVTRRLRRVR
ncbi:murein biosynthesis integral membrane protein MurJ [Demequina sp. NBRC 110054]|uniref:murein biosynthesis integral membrane protein MurJ n=1 Tax=Demequina sp. NBRC 110054 TaxID=1570343 RepID=UPI0013566955|nr:lipid II flippase MurJ [Demequina sp. NBRC 110054]